MFAIYKVRGRKKQLLLLIFDVIGYLFFLPIRLVCSMWDVVTQRCARPLQSIVVMRLDNMGDMLLTTNFLLNIRKNFPVASVMVVCRPCQESVLVGLVAKGVIDDVVTYDAPWFGGKDSWGAGLSLLGRLWRQFDMGFELHGEPLSVALLAGMSRFSVGFGIRGGGFLLDISCRYDRLGGKNIVEHQHDLLSLVGIPVVEKKLFLAVGDTVTLPAGLHREKSVVMVHTGVSVAHRQWPVAYREELLVGLQVKYEVLVVDVDQEKLDYLREATGCYVCQPVGLQDFFDLVEQVDALIGLDSLASHVAAALDKPLVSIRSGTVPVGLTNPRGDPDKIVVLDPHDLVDTIDLETAFAFENPYIRMITPAMVLAALGRVL